jgi:nickel/cobalt exporter
MKPLVASFCYLFLCAPTSVAHEVVGNNRDRKIVVQVAYEPNKNEVVVRVAYRVELGYQTAMLDLKGSFDYERVKRDTRAFGDEFIKFYAPVFGKNLSAKGDDNDLKFAVVEQEPRHEDEEGRALGHLRCDLLYRASFPARPGKEQRFRFREDNYLYEPGHVELSLVAENPLRVQSKSEPDEKLKKTPLLLLRPGDDDRLREAALTFTIPADAAKKTTAGPRGPEIATTANDKTHDHVDLFQLFLRSDHAVWVLLLLSVAIGAVHALTPGHGKTLVAAYLVGEHGTVGHALVLGVVTTVTHTGIVLVLALVLWFLFPTGLSAQAQQHLQTGLGLIMGLLVACLGFWLLLRRLSGRADHFHIGGGHHHHHNGADHPDHHHDHAHADHDHAADGSAVPRGPRRVGWWGLIVLGMSGGIVPCWDAVAMLVFAVGVNLLWLAVPMLLAFSAGLASVLVVIGILVVHAKRFADSRWGEGRLVRSLPIISAVCVMGLGLWLCYGSLPARP